MPDRTFTGRSHSVDIVSASSTVDQWTDAVTVKNRGVIGIENTGDLIANVTLQGRPAIGGVWIEMEIFAVGASTQGIFEFHGYGSECRVGVQGVKVTDYVSGEGTLHLKG